jgi:hypothetical protein
VQRQQKNRALSIDPDLHSPIVNEVQASRKTPGDFVWARHLRGCISLSPERERRPPPSRSLSGT